MAMIYASAASAAKVTVPNNVASGDGSDDNVIPLTFTPSYEPSMRSQQVFAASQFAALKPGGEYITAIAFRSDAYARNVPFSLTIPRVQINLSTTDVAPDNLSATFALNVGNDDTAVFGPASLTLATSYDGPFGSVALFDMLVQLTNPFFYDPSDGNLLLDVRNINPGPVFRILDAVIRPGDSISRNLSGDVNALTAVTVDSAGLVVQFTTQIPEPSAFAIAATGLFALSAIRRRRSIAL
jgi:hypothetical protein